MNLRNEINKITKYIAMSSIAMANIALLIACIGLFHDAYRIDMRFSSTAPMVRVEFIVSQNASHLSFRRFLIYVESFFISPDSGQVCEAAPRHRARVVG